LQSDDDDAGPQSPVDSASPPASPADNNPAVIVEPVGYSPPASPDGPASPTSSIDDGPASPVEDFERNSPTDFLYSQAEGPASPTGSMDEVSEPVNQHENLQDGKYYSPPASPTDSLHSQGHESEKQGSHRSRSGSPASPGSEDHSMLPTLSQSADSPAEEKNSSPEGVRRSRSLSPVDGDDADMQPELTDEDQSGQKASAQERTGSQSSPVHSRSPSISPTRSGSRASSPARVESRSPPVHSRSPSFSPARSGSRASSPARSRSGSRSRSPGAALAEVRSRSPSVSGSSRSGSPAAAGSRGASRSRSVSPAGSRGPSVGSRSRSGSPGGSRSRSVSPALSRSPSRSPSWSRSRSTSPARVGNDSVQAAAVPYDFCFLLHLCMIHHNPWPFLYLSLSLHEVVDSLYLLLISCLVIRIFVPSPAISAKSISFGLSVHLWMQYLKTVHENFTKFTT